MTALPVETAQEALFIAMEMERRAIALYERAGLLSPKPDVAGVLKTLLRDERRHLQHFSALAQGEDVTGEQGMLLSAQAAGILHAGGLMGAAREEAFEDANSLIAYAAREESDAVDTYQAFAQACTGPARDAFLLIAGEEAHHLNVLNALIEKTAT